MTLIPQGLLDNWKTAVDDLLIDLGSDVELVFESGLTQTTTTTVDQDGLKSRVIMPFGGRGRGFSVPGNPTLAETTDNNTQHIQVNEIKKIINARIYHVPKDLERFNIHVSHNTNVYEIVTNKKYLPELIRADYAILFKNLIEKRIKVKLIKSPTVYGLGGPHHCRSFWQEVG